MPHRLLCRLLSLLQPPLQLLTHPPVLLQLALLLLEARRRHHGDRHLALVRLQDVLVPVALLRRPHTLVAKRTAQRGKLRAKVEPRARSLCVHYSHSRYSTRCLERGKKTYVYKQKKAKIN